MDEATLKVQRALLLDVLQVLAEFGRERAARRVAVAAGQRGDTSLRIDEETSKDAPGGDDGQR